MSTISFPLSTSMVQVLIETDTPPKGGTVKFKYPIVFGPAGEELENPDRVQSTNELTNFTAAYHETNRLAHLSETNCVLEVGTDL